ncbi:MAG: serine hydrolase domain-containing protein, partial [Pedobacter sp.]|nr:serine hydrolase domain-containing protein [Pedobacter sp.]
KISFILFIVFLSKFSFAQDPRKKQLDQMFVKAYRDGKFNGNVLVADKGRIVYSASFGYADTGGKQKLGVSHRFHIGSIAKEFNAVAIMMLQEQGKLKVGDKLSKYLPGLPKWADSISILNLLQYTSGVPNSNWKDIKGDASNLASLQKVKQLDFTPGTKYAYNNNNVFLQRQVVEKISGMPFRDFVEEKMLKPLKMDHTIIDPTLTESNLAQGYSNLKVVDDVTPPFSGWVCPTIGDFYQWAMAIDRFRLIGPESTKVIAQSYAPESQAGLGHAAVVDRKMISHVHDGTARSYQALLVSAVPKGRTILLMTNNQQGNLYPINDAIQAILDGKEVDSIGKE